MVDLVIVGTDRVPAIGAVGNKIALGVIGKALAAHDKGVPFYVALPSPTIVFLRCDGIAEFPIEQRGPRKWTDMTVRPPMGGSDGIGSCRTVRGLHYGFDVTPASAGDGIDHATAACLNELAHARSRFREQATAAE